MTPRVNHRLNGIEPDNLLAFLALLGVLRALETDGRHANVRVSWSTDDPPVRPVLHLTTPATQADVVQSIATGLNTLAAEVDFGARRDLRLSPDEGADLLKQARGTGSNTLWSALVSDAVMSRDGATLAPTPLCLMFGQGHQHFLSRVASVPRLETPQPRGRGRAKVTITAEQSLTEAIFDQWRRPDPTESFRWDPREDVRYALRANDPTDTKTKERTQHGANRLAPLALPMLPVAPRVPVGGKPRLTVRGGGRDKKGRFTISWPIWRHPISLASICHLMDHPRLDPAARGGRHQDSDPEIRMALGVVEVRRATRVSNAKFMNFTAAEPVDFETQGSA